MSFFSCRDPGDNIPDRYLPVFECRAILKALIDSLAVQLEPAP